MPKICPLFSGSSGNVTYISDGDDAILIDVGVSAKRIKVALCNLGLDINSLKAIYITHAHYDHISGLKTLANQLKIPICASEGTFADLIKCEKLPECCDINLADGVTSVGTMEITRFETSHDAKGSSGYVIKFKNGDKIGVCTDLGYISEEVKSSLLGCKVVMIESNHDISMLANGPYPIALKMRISGKEGHLSNSACAEFLPELVKCGAVRFILGHLSKENNLPEIAKSTSIGALLAAGYTADEDYILTVASDEGNQVITL